MTLNVPPNSCSSCPYRRDAPPCELPACPLYASGAEAADAGLAGVRRPGRAALQAIRRIVRRRKRR